MSKARCQNIGLFLGLTVIAWAVLVYPAHNYQSILSQGDHGRDLYAFQKTLEGQMPYRDYWWVYGPLMPYIYATFMKFLGVSIHTVLLTKYFLVGLCGIFVFLSLATLISSSFAFLGACWFFLFYPDFFFTYNHIGGVLTSIIVLFCILKYLKNLKVSHLFTALFFVFLTLLIKVNFGLTALAITFLASILIDIFGKLRPDRFKILFYLTAVVLIPAATFGIYSFFLKGLTIHEIRQCLPYLGGDQPYEMGPWTALKILFESLKTNLKFHPSNLIFTFIIGLSLFQTIRVLINRTTDTQYRRKIILGLAITFTFFIFNMHEFMISGVYYRMFWATPFGLMLTFIILAVGFEGINKIIRLLFHALVLVVFFFQAYNGYIRLDHQKTPEQFLSIHLGNVYVGNHPYWIQTVREGTKFLRTTLKPDETFFALPYDPIYYYLTEKTSPTRQLIFFEHIKIPSEQEQRIIQNLEEHHINWILVSNRANSDEQGLGILGKTYCPLIGKYIDENFEVVLTIGDWVNKPGWGWNHGIKIYKRKK